MTGRSAATGGGESPPAAPPAGPLVSVVIVNWNGAHLLPACLAAVQAQTWPIREVIVVDNGSTDGSAELLARWEAEGALRVLRLGENTGFARANNLAFREARGEWVALLNNDAFPEPEWLDLLLRRGDRAARRGMLGGKVLFDEKRDTLDKAGHLLYPDGLNRGRGCQEPDRGQFDREEEILWPDGCAALYHRDLLAETGGFDDAFFAYGDDADLGMRARLLGWSAWYVPPAVVYHRHSATSGEYSPLKAMLVERNRIFLALKNFPLSLLLLNPWYSLCRYACQAFGAFGRKGAAGRFVERHGRLRLVGTLFWAYASAAKQLPAMLAKRRAVQRRRVLTTREVHALVKRFRIGVRELSLRD